MSSATRASKGGLGKLGNYLKNHHRPDQAWLGPAQLRHA
jgi:hypothetical protein